MRQAAELRARGARDQPVGIVPWIILPLVRRGQRGPPSGDSRVLYSCRPRDG